MGIQHVMMSSIRSPIQFIGGAITNKLGATAGNSTMPLNSGLTGGAESFAQSGDFVIGIFASSSSGDRTLSITDGTTAYTLIGAELFGNSTLDVNLRVAYKFITEADTSVTFGPTGATTDVGCTAVYVFRYVDPTTPLGGVTPTTATIATSRLANPPSITPVTPRSYIVCVGSGCVASTGVGPYNTPADLTGWFTDTRAGASTSFLTPIVGIGHKNDWTTGAFDAAAFTLAAGGDSTATASAAISFVLKPA